MQFHYDVSNEFYSLFLDPDMQYSCAYFRDWENTLEQAQQDKLDMICRKLRLKAGERMLDIGCGWGALLVHAVQKYGVVGHGVTLSQCQYDFALDKVRRLGLDDRIQLELRDYRELRGTYDKIASIGMYEHVGLANMPLYFRTVRSLLRDRGVFLNHGITRGAKVSNRRFRRIRPERRLILKYIFPGSDLAHVGNTVMNLEAHGFEVHDVEGWREHYARTTRLPTWGKSGTGCGWPTSPESPSGSTTDPCAFSRSWHRNTRRRAPRAFRRRVTISTSADAGHRHLKASGTSRRPPIGTKTPSPLPPGRSTQRCRRERPGPIDGAGCRRRRIPCRR